VSGIDIKKLRKYDKNLENSIEIFSGVRMKITLDPEKV
jgi:hypothetical protein